MLRNVGSVMMRPQLAGAGPLALQGTCTGKQGRQRGVMCKLRNVGSVLMRPRLAGAGP